MTNILKPLIAILIFASCQDEKEVEPPVERQPVNVSFSVGGEIDLENENPIGGRVPGDLGTVYGVAIHKKVDDRTTFYLGGVFNSLDHIQTDLFSDESYVVYFSALQRGTSLGLAYDKIGDDIVFTRLFSTILRLENEFLDYLGQGFHIQANDIATYEDENSIDVTISNSLVDRFDGKVELNNPSESDSVVTIQLRRVSFGLAFRAENLDDNDTLQITLYSGPGSPFDYHLTRSDPENYQIRTLEDNGFDITNDQVVNLHSTFELKVYDDSNSFVRNRLLTIQDIIVKRNVKRTYVVDLNDFGNGAGGRNSFQLDYIDDDLVDEGEFAIGG